MCFLFRFSTAAMLGTALLAQAPASSPSQPGLKWRGSIWASALTQNRESADGTLVFRPVEAGPSQFTLDGVMFGADATFAKGWSAKFTLLAGQVGKVVQTTTGDTGTVAAVEAMVTWTGERDTLRVGRMITFIGMEFLDGSQDITASRGLLYTFTDPFGQVGVNWHHAFNATWSSDVWAFNGEDRIKDNNHGKTVGLGLTYNHSGSAERYLSIHAYRGPEQDGLGSAANTGAEGRQRERVCAMGQWIWGKSTLQGEVSLGREQFAAAAILGATGPVDASWKGFGLIYRYELANGISLFARAEHLSDEHGVRLSADTSIRTTLGLDGQGTSFLGRLGAGLKAQSFAAGVEKKHGPAFARVEVRRDQLNRDLTDAKGDRFKDGVSGTVSLGASF
ncbi:MAG: outer membrane beta-barrel protein [Holophagaceae bacterium]|nr:outer membrane beta-barrel protein [Holophagaceae bacterium]